MDINTIPKMFFNACQKYDKPNAILVKTGGSYKPHSHKFFKQRVSDFGRGLIELGMSPKEHCAILAETCFDWAVADLGIVSAGGVDVPIYPTLSAEQIAWIINNSDSMGVVVSNREQAEKVLSIRAQCPFVRFIVQMEPNPPEGVLSMHDVEERGRSADNESEYNSRWQNQGKDDLLTIIYTSGTTGNPKGVMLTHGNLIANIKSCMPIAPFSPEDTHLSHLPLSHVLERMGGFYLMIHCGVSIAYAEDVQSVSDNLREVQPTVMFSVPRLFEKIYGRVMSAATQGSFVKKMIFNWSMGVGKKAVPYLANNAKPEGFLAKKWDVADKLVYTKIKEKTGGKLKFLISGGAPLAKEISELFLGLGLTLVEGYGLTESSPVLTINLPEHNKPGTVGPAVENVEIKIAEDGEILARGPNIMQGYYKNPEATASTLIDGWLHTGDIGTIDDEGYVTITDRKKDLIITSGGKNLAPAPIENALKLSAFIEQAVVVGDNRKFIGALIVPPWETIRDWAPGFGWGTDPVELANNEEFRDFIHREVDMKLKDFAHHEKVKKFEILTEPFTIETGELTPSMKVKRKVVNEKFKEAVDRIYQ